MSKEIVVVSAAWCGNCGTLKNDLTRAGIIYKVVNADEEEGMDFCRENGVRGLPTAFVYEDDKIVKTIVGVQKLEEYI